MKGICFTTVMVQAINDNRKSMTRRILKPQPVLENNLWHLGGAYWSETINPTLMPCHSLFNRTPYKPGEIVYVKESYANLTGMGFGNDPRTDKPWIYAYKADCPEGSESDRARKDYGVVWKSGRFMPASAARTFLKFTDVKAERIQDISEEDAKSEGIGMPLFRTDEIEDYGYIECFSRLWDSVYSKPKPVYTITDGIKSIDHYESYPWEDIHETRTYRGKPWIVCGNPWTWVYRFEKTEVR